jgi:tRNA (guanine37-N1)-methyltransferase
MSFAVTIFTVLPEIFPGPLGYSLAGTALKSGLWSLTLNDIRAHGLGRHRSVDDTPAGGGPGMILRADVLAKAIDAGLAADDPRPRLLTSPRGERLTQALVRKFASGPGLVLVCGRFEGVDERIIEGRQLTEISLGDFVLSGGEIAAIALVDACVRLLPGVMGSHQSAGEESFEGGLLEYPQFTKPRLWEGREIPAVLTSGHHDKIAAFRRAEALRLTRERRPDLLEGGKSLPET